MPIFNKENIVVIVLLVFAGIVGTLYNILSTEAVESGTKKYEKVNIVRKKIRKRKIVKRKKTNMVVVKLEGEINRPGFYKVKKGTTLGQVIKMAGGITSFADRRIDYNRKIFEDEVIFIDKR